MFPRGISECISLVNYRTVTLISHWTRTNHERQGFLWLELVTTRSEIYHCLRTSFFGHYSLALQFLCTSRTCSCGGLLTVVRKDRRWNGIQRFEGSNRCDRWKKVWLCAQRIVYAKTPTIYCEFRLVARLAINIPHSSFSLAGTL